MHPALPLITLAVWLQSPSNALRYKELGINLYVGLWRGPTEAQLSELKTAGMPVICEFNSVGKAHLNDPLIAAWMHGDEPDNAQSQGEGKGYGPPIPPAEIQRNYHALKEWDPSRQVLLNLGQGVAWNGWYGRGERTNHPEDYGDYAKGCDIASFDIYPGCHDHPDVAGKLAFVPDGVRFLRRQVQDEKPVWACIETTRISNPERKASPRDVRNEAWMALIAGARGLIYFCHQFKPNFIEAGLLADPEMSAMVASLNKQIQELAPVLASPTIGVLTDEENSDYVPWMEKSYGGFLYLFRYEEYGKKRKVPLSFVHSRIKAGAKAEVLGENRSEVLADKGEFEDSFEPYEVHLYRTPKP